MASEWYSDVRPDGVKAKKGKGAPTGPHGGTPVAEMKGPLTEKTANWPTDIGPKWATTYNRKTRVPVVKQYAKKYGVD